MPDQLVDLVSDLLSTGQETKVSSVVDQFGPRIGLPAWQLDKYRIRAAHEMADVIEISERIFSSSAPVHERAWAMVRIGGAYARDGQRERAFQVFDTVIASFSSDQEAAMVLNIARQHRTMLAAGR